MIIMTVIPHDKILCVEHSGKYTYHLIKDSETLHCPHVMTCRDKREEAGSPISSSISVLTGLTEEGHEKSQVSVLAVWRL